MISAEQYEQLVEFLAGRMTAAEKESFLAMVAQDDALKEELEWEKIFGQQDDPYGEIAEIIGQPVAPVVHAKVPIMPSFRFFSSLAAASILALVLLGISYLMVDGRRDNGQVVKNTLDDKPFNKPDTPGIRISHQPAFDNLLAYNESYSKFAPGSELPEDLANVQLAYRAANYKRVIEEAGSISQARGGNPVAAGAVGYEYFFKGLAYLELNDPPHAISQFDLALKNSSDKSLHDDILWYKALAYLKQNKIAECRAILEVLSTRKMMRKNLLQLLKQLPKNEGH